MVESLKAERRVAPGTDFARLFADREGGRLRTEPNWLEERRSQAMARFSGDGYPTSRLEDWRYTNVALLARTAFVVPDAGGRSIAGDSLPLAGLDAIRLVFVDGRFSQAHSSTDMPKGLRAGSLRAALASNPERLEAHLAVQESHGKQPFLALNTALFEDGAWIEVDSGTELERPILIHHITTNTSAPGASQPAAVQARSLIVLGANSRASVIESYSLQPGSLEALSFTNAVTEAVVGAGARLDHFKLQEEQREAYHLATSKVRVERDAELRSYLISLGARLARNLLEVAFAAPGGSCSLQGLYVVGDQQHADCQTFVDHAVPHCTSEQNYRGILAGDSRGVFQGGVLVRPDAQKTSAQQSNKNLVLSDRAKADSKPQLEIHADDVKCTHGATIGELDPSAIFFLRSRGIDEPAARSMLTGAFAGEIAETIGIEPLHEYVKQAVAKKLAGAGSGTKQGG